MVPLSQILIKRAFQQLLSQKVNKVNFSQLEPLSQNPKGMCFVSKVSLTYCYAASSKTYEILICCIFNAARPCLVRQQESTWQTVILTFQNAREFGNKMNMFNYKFTWVGHWVVLRRACYSVIKQFPEALSNVTAFQK